jgi:hypothetical protein
LIADEPEATKAVPLSARAFMGAQQRARASTGTHRAREINFFLMIFPSS